MDIQEHWEKALKNTEIVRPRVRGLLTFSTTKLPYIFLSESSVNIGDTVIRKGEVLVERPFLILPSNHPQFEGFDLEKESPFSQENLTSFLMVRGVTFPSLRYNNKTYSLDIQEGSLKNAIRHHLDQLQRTEDVFTGLVAGPEDCWQFSVMIFICSQVAKSVEGDLKKLQEELRRKARES